MIVDDDDWQADNRIQKQNEVLDSYNLCCSSHHYMWSITRRMGTERVNPSNLIGGNSAFNKVLWERYPYKETMMRLCDANFVAYHLAHTPNEFLDMRDPYLFVYLIHGKNISGVFEGGIDATAKVRWMFDKDYDDIVSLGE